MERDHAAHARADIALAESEILLIDQALPDARLDETVETTLRQLRRNAIKRIEWANNVLRAYP